MIKICIPTIRINRLFLWVIRLPPVSWAGHVALKGALCSCSTLKVYNGIIQASHSFFCWIGCQFKAVLLVSYIALAEVLLGHTGPTARGGRAVLSSPLPSVLTCRGSHESCSFQHLPSPDGAFCPALQKMFSQDSTPLRVNSEQGQSIYLFLAQSNFPPIPKNRLAECEVWHLYWTLLLTHLWGNVFKVKWAN